MQVKAVLAVLATVAGVVVTPLVVPAAATTTAPSFVPVAPVRIADTGDVTKLAPLHVETVPIAGHAGVPASGAVAVSLSITAAHSSAPGYLTAYAHGTTRPALRSVSFGAGIDRTSATVVQLPAAGSIDVFDASTSAVRVLVDINGYYTASSAGGAFVPVTPYRLASSTVGAQGSLAVPVSGHGGVPTTGAAAAVLSVSATSTAASGWLTAHPDGIPRSGVTVYFDAHVNETQLAVTAVRNGRIDVDNVSAGSSIVSVVVLGYLRSGTASPATGGTVVTTPARLFGPAPIAAHGHQLVPVLGHAGVPATGVAAVVLTLRASAVPAGGVFTAQAGQTAPTTGRVLSVQLHGRTAALAIVRVGADGTIDIGNSAASAVTPTVDVMGYVTGTPAQDTIAPPPVTGLVTTATRSSVTLAWTNPPTTDLTGVTVRRAIGTTPPASAGDGTAVAEVAAASHGYLDSGLTPNTTYSYSLFAHDAAGNQAAGASTTVRLVSTQDITGTVRSAGTSAPLAGVVVTARTADAAARPVIATTGADGGYDLAGVAADTDYQVCFEPIAVADQPAGGYAHQCWSDGAAGGDPSVFVPAGAVRSGVDASLSAGGTITGTVTDADGNPLGDVGVAEGAGAFARTRTAADGTYVLSGVPAGRTAVCFDAANATGGDAPHGYRDQCFSGDDLMQGDQTVPVLAGQTTPGIDVRLDDQVTVSGTVTGPVCRVPADGPCQRDTASAGQTGRPRIER